MRLDAFDYQLPNSLIAQRPLANRSDSRLMVVERESGRFEHAYFRDIAGYLRGGDSLVVNRSRVIPARLFIVRRGGGEGELFVTKVLDDYTFVAIGAPLRKLRPGDDVRGEQDTFTCRIEERVSDREVRARVTSPHTVSQVLESFGHVPLPPYIQRADEPGDAERYQTVFADEKGSVAAPTAGLHFDEALLRELESAGIVVREVVLHVGLGTFLPLDAEEVEKNRLHAEEFAIDAETIRGLAEARARGGRIVAVGTTVTRLLETAAARRLFDGTVEGDAYRGETDLFIYPGYGFRFVDQLVTNFHLPKSSLLLLVCAFLGREKTLACYEEAVREKYRFYSYGDAMLIR